jgi:signal transduction histidine kinase/CheY-like chemotaxis protein
MERKNSYFDEEIHLDPEVVLAPLLLVALGIAIALEPVVDHLILTVVFLAYEIVTVTMLSLRNRLPLVSRYYGIASAVVAVMLVHHSSYVAGALHLLAIPPLLAASLIGSKAALLTAIAETGLLIVVSAGEGVELGVMLSALGALWVTTLVAGGVYRRIAQLHSWLDESFRKSQTLLSESRERAARTSQVNEALARANRQLSLAYERMAAFRELAERAQQSKADFVARVSHEFRTPLNMIIGLTDLMAGHASVYGDSIPPTLAEDLHIVQRNAEHLASMVDDVLDLSRIETDRMPLQKKDVDLERIIRRAVEIVHPLLDKKGLRLELDIPDSLEPVFCDAIRIRQVILNLISNAARFTETGSIRVEVAAQPNTVRVSVHDTGPGIESDDLERIFEPFQQATETTRMQLSGSGLGLSLSRQFVELHGGRMSAQSTPGVGSSFSFDLPSRRGAPPAERSHRWIQEEWQWLATQSRLELPDEHFIPHIVIHGASPEFASSLRRYDDQVELTFVDDLGIALNQAADYPTHALIVAGSTSDVVLERVRRAREVLADVPVIGCRIEQSFTVPHIAGTRDHLVKPVGRADLAYILSTLEGPAHHILVVDDDPEVRLLLKRTLHAIDETLAVDTVASAESALETLKRVPYTLVLLDLMLPDMSGVEFIERKMETPSIRDVPVIVISAQDRLSRPPWATLLTLAAHEGVTPRNLLRTALAFATIQSTTTRPRLPELR